MCKSVSHALKRSPSLTTAVTNRSANILKGYYCIMLLEETKTILQTPTFDGVSSESRLTLVSGTSRSDWDLVDRTGFTLSGSSRSFVPRTLTTLACAASRSFLLSARGDLLWSVVASENVKDRNYPFNLPSRLKWTERPGDGDFERLLGDPETLRLYPLTTRLFLRLL